jgi:glycosyltransferase involved in cell wall biosynthesis
MGAERLLVSLIDTVDRRHADHELRARIEPTTEWVRRAEITAGPLVSVVLATRNRAELLSRAVDSVRAQVYTDWELVVVDDGSTDETPRLLAEWSAADPRIVVVTGRGGNVGAARNAGLSAAHGAYVCYLDDDNHMEPLWLKAVAWAVSRHPAADVFYGARRTDGEPAPDGSPSGSPSIQFDAWDRHRLEAGNFIDLGVIAHRRSLPEAIFDERLERLGDWDLILRLTTSTEAVALPVVALTYTTDAPHRISRTVDGATSEAAVRAKLLASRPLRVLAYNSLFPLVPETYIAEEMHALSDNGIALAWMTEQLTPSPVRLDEPLYTDLDEAVAEFAPDVLFLYWATFASERSDVLTRIGLPFAVRVHSFDFDPTLVERVRSHPLCIGVWTYPHHADVLDGAHPLVPLLNERDAFPPDGDRTIVLSASAGLPKKDWPTLVGAFAELADRGVDCRIIVGTTYLHEDEPQIIQDLIDESGAPVALSVDVPHDEVIGLLGRTAAVVYSKVPGGPMGMPRSIIEGMYAGASVIMPDRPESVLTGGPDCRTYTSAADIVRHVDEILAGGPDIDAERAANRQRAECQFADPAHGATFAAEVAKSLAQWRSR